MACSRADKAFADVLESATKVSQVGIELFCHRCNSLEHVQWPGGHFDGLRSMSQPIR